MCESSGAPDLPGVGGSGNQSIFPPPGSPARTPCSSAETNPAAARTPPSFEISSATPPGSENRLSSPHAPCHRTAHTSPARCPPASADRSRAPRIRAAPPAEPAPAWDHFAPTPETSGLPAGSASSLGTGLPAVAPPLRSQKGPSADTRTSPAPPRPSQSTASHSPSAPAATPPQSPVAPSPPRATRLENCMSYTEPTAWQPARSAQRPALQRPQPNPPSQPQR